MEWFFANLALLLDSLPAEGRLLLLAALLSVAFAGFGRSLPTKDALGGVNLLYRKAALVCLCLIPALVYLLGVRLPVAVEEVTLVSTLVPAFVTLALFCVWLAGAVYHGYRLWKRLRHTTRTARAADAHESAQGRLQHWQNRLDVKKTIRLNAAGSETPWHVSNRGSATIVLPGAARNWPTGVVDVMLLQQLAQIKQNAWRWLCVGRVVQVLYWPMPWVARMVDDLARFMINPATKLAKAALRDPEGWERDRKKLEQRFETLDQLSLDDPEWLRLPYAGAPVEDEVPRLQGLSFEERLSLAYRNKRARVRDPHEHAYWLVAAASILVATATTLTRVPMAPEQDYVPLLQQWDTTMLRTVTEYGEDASDSGQNQEN